MFVSAMHQAFWISAALSLGLLTEAEDLHFKRSISVSGNALSTSETWVKGARERTVSNSVAGPVIMLRQCDLKRTVTLNDGSQSYLVADDPPEESTAKFSALKSGAPAHATTSAGAITQTATVTDTGERKPMSGYEARHLKTLIVVQSSPHACAQVNQRYEIDGWYADIAKEPLSCSQFLMPVKQTGGCSDKVVVRRKGAAKPGYPLHESITYHNEDSTTTNLEVTTSEISREQLKADLFEVPAGYHEVKSEAELYLLGPSQQPALANSLTPPLQPNAPSSPALSHTSAPTGLSGKLGMLTHGLTGPLQNAALGMQGMPGPAGGAAIPLPQALGPKTPGKIRVGIAPAQAQLGQGNNSQADYSTPIRDAMVYLMNGPAVEISALDARLPIQLQSEAQKKQCDYILLSSVTVAHSNSGLSKLMKAGSMAANLTPLGMMSKGMSGMIASQVAMQAAAMTTQQQAMNQLAGFNGQIKSKDEVTVEYHLIPAGQTEAKLENSLKGKSKSDGEDVLTPLIQQAANAILAEVTKK